MRDFITNIIRGFGWGLGFSLAFVLLIWTHQTFIGNPPQKVEYSWPDDEVSNSEDLSPEELEDLRITINSVRMVEGKIIVSGKIVSKIERDAFWVEIETKVHLNGEVIEICKPDSRTRINVGSELEFLTFCASKWNEIKLEDVQVETSIAKASGYKNS